MSDYTVVTADNMPVEITPSIEPHLKEFQLTGSTPYSANGCFGHMLFQHFAGIGFDLWYSHYSIKKSASFTGTVNVPILELQIPLLSSFQSSWDGMGHIAMQANQFELSYAPYVNVNPDLQFQRSIKLSISTLRLKHSNPMPTIAGSSKFFSIKQ